MNRRVVIKIGSGTIASGYAAAVQIGDEGTAPQAEVQGYLPPAPDLPGLYQRWQQSYWQLGLAYRLEAKSGITNVSTFSDIEACRSLSRELRDRVHHWLNGDDFRPIREKLLEQLNPYDTTRILLQTQDPLLQRLPWYELQFFERYRQAEVGVCAVNYQQSSYPGTRSAQVRILAVIGDATGLNIETDKALLSKLPNADVHFLQEPSREAFNQQLWDAKGWDILFFAGHSNSNPNCQNGSGEILLNPTDTLTIPQLKHALKKAIDRGLNTAIFNSCDGLGLAADLADLYIPQVLVMREPVPDRVAHAFLQGFLDAFSSGTPFYIAIREAREKLQGLEAHYPCATWLPVIVQNLAETPPTWESLQGKTESHRPSTHPPFPLPPLPFPPSPLSPSPSLSLKSLLKPLITATLLTTATLALARFLAPLIPLELAAYDAFLRSRPTEALDDRLLIITNTDADIDRYPNLTGNSSLSDETLLALLDKLTPLEPELIGLDIYRSHAAKDPALARQIGQTENLVAICKVTDNTLSGTTNTAEKSPPPELLGDTRRIGASDFITEGGILRRHLIQLDPPANSPCKAKSTFSTIIAHRYLQQTQDIPPKGADYFGKTQLKTLNKFGGDRNLNTQGAQILLNYRILQDPKQTNCGDVKEALADCITVSEVFEQDAAQLSEDVKGRIVLIGTTAPGADPWLTPYTSASAATEPTPGVFIQAQMISQLVSAGLGERPLLTLWPEWKETIWIFAWALLGGIISLYHCQNNRWHTKLLLQLLAGEGFLLIVCWLWFTQAAVWVPWVPSAIALPATALTTQMAFKAKSRTLSKTVASQQP
ncbi:MAG: CHASE2 domain-containing protein [Phormidesmis sp.]